jgi:hypothetical protein
MAHESEQNAAFEAFAEAAASPLSDPKAEPAAGRYEPGSAQDRLARMPPDELKKAYRDAQILVNMRKILGAITVSAFLVTGGIGLPFFIFIILSESFLDFFSILLFGGLFDLSFVCLLVTFLGFQSSFAKQVIRIGSVEAAVFATVILVYVLSDLFRTALDGGFRRLTPGEIIEKDNGQFLGFSLGVIGLIFAPLTCMTTFNPNLFGTGRFTYAQIKYVREKREAGLEPDRIPPPARFREPDFAERLITGGAAFGLIYLPLFFLWLAVAANKGWLE